MTYLSLIIPFILSFLLTFLVRKLALKKNIIDNPNERSSHTVPTPRGGGLAIVIVWFLGLSYFFINGQVEQELFFALLSGIVLAIVSALDDVLDLSPKVRLIAQALSALGALYFLGGFNLFAEQSNFILFGIINLIVFIGIIWFINLYNFLDGIDAYASQEAILVALGLWLLSGNSLMGVLIAATAGFLVWNWPKAKIFMGDVGSTQLGFILIVLALHFHNVGEVNIVNWLILTSVFWFDATYTLFRRWRNNEKLSQAHKKHMYQRLNQSGYSHLKVDTYAIAFNILLIATVYLNHQIIHQGILLLVVVVAVLFMVSKWIDRKIPFKTKN